MSVLKYKDPVTGKWNVCKVLKIVETSPPSEEMPSDIPYHVKAEAMRVAENVKGVLRSDSIVSVNMSDSHYVGEKATNDENKQNDVSSVRACMALKALTYLLPVDFVAHLGDLGRGTAAEDNATHKKQITDYMGYFREAVGNVPVFACIGNHDTAIYYHKTQNDAGNIGIHTLPGDWLYENITSLSESGNTVMAGKTNGGYCYRDFPNKKLRVFMLNTSENLIANQDDRGTSEAQQLWVAQALLELNEKTDASSWGFIVLSHYALDYGEAWRISRVFNAYVDGGIFTIGGEEKADFAENNSAKFLAQFHGHFHCFKTDNIHGSTTEDGWSMQPYGVWRLCTPNAGYNAENTYSGRSFYNISFGEQDTYHKTANRADETSLVVNVVNPSENRIYSFCYGAGYDRVLATDGEISYSVTKNLTYVTIEDESGESIREGDSYFARIVPGKAGVIQSVVVQMRGEDVTSRCYNADTGEISIEAVTGLIVITAAATIPSEVNLVTLATEPDGKTPYGDNYDGVGENDGYRIGTQLGSFVEVNTDKTVDAVSTGYIALVPYNKTITIKNIGTTVVNFTAARIVGYRNNTGVNHERDKVAFEASLAPDGESIIVTPDRWTDTYRDIKYIRVSGKWTGKPPEVYASDIISYGVTKNLSYVSIENDSGSAVEAGGTYSCKIAPKKGCVLKSVYVGMGGKDVTSDAYTEETGEIRISPVTGAVIITAVATVAPGTNLVTLATAEDKVSPYEGDGYRRGTMLGSFTEVSSEEFADGVATGWIELTPYNKTIVIANIGTEKVNYTAARIVGYRNTGVNNERYALAFEADLAPNGEIITITPDRWTDTHRDIKYIRVSGKWTGSPPEVYVASGASHGVTKNLTYASVTNETGSVIADGGSYACTVVPNLNCTIESVVVTMGGVDVTSEYYTEATGEIRIPSVTGAVVITVIAKAPDVNLVSLATKADGSTPFGEDYNSDGIADGYQKGMFIGSSSEITTDAVADGVCTGWIALVPYNKTITIKNVSTTAVNWSDARIIGCRTMAVTDARTTIKFAASDAPNGEDIVVDSSQWNDAYGDIKYIRVCGKWTGNAPEIYAE
jgi:hypothetical protein